MSRGQEIHDAARTRGHGNQPSDDKL